MDGPDEAGLLCPQSGPPEHPAGLCTAPGSCPSPRVLGWPGSRCGQPPPPYQAASAEEREERWNEKPTTQTTSSIMIMSQWLLENQDFRQLKYMFCGILGFQMFS